MKKIFAIVLSAVLCLCMAVPAFAAGTPEAEYTGQTSGQDVNITISGDMVHVYLVDIEFTNPTFTYSSGSKWNPDTYQYEPSTGAEWAGEGTVKIINHSDLPVNYDITAENVPMLTVRLASTLLTEQALLINATSATPAEATTQPRPSR